MDTIKFAQLVSFVSAFAEREMDASQISSLYETLSRSRFGAASVSDVDDLLRHMKAGSFIEAIKAYRTLTGEGLKESKDAIERYRTTPSSHAA